MVKQKPIKDGSTTSETKTDTLSSFLPSSNKPMPNGKGHQLRPPESLRESLRESLMTHKALQLSLSPPRCPPFGTAHRSVLLGVHPHDDEPYAEHDNDDAYSKYNLHSGIREGLVHLLYNARPLVRHPHLLFGPDSADQITRFLGSLLPLHWLNHVRDSGGFRLISDTLVESTIPVGAVANPSAALTFLHLSRRCKPLRYGDHAYQYIELYHPDEERCSRNNWTGMVFFVHGGAWGSGKSWYYRLVAQSFLDLNMAVAIVGYRVYPYGNVACQVADLENAYVELARQFPDLCGPKRIQREIGFCVMGHSSGAHISLLWLVKQAKRYLDVKQSLYGTVGRGRAESEDEWRVAGDAFIGISGIYNVAHHFDYEAARGVEELSPMKACNGYSREHFRLNSPPLCLQDFLATFPEGTSKSVAVDRAFPRLLLVHGIEDETVPFTSTSEGARILRSCGIHQCDEFYAPLTGHQDAVMHLMLGGRVKNFIQGWLCNLNSHKLLKSKL